MEAMTQEFMLHRRPHVEIWSTREGSDDDTFKIHFRNKTPMDPKRCQQRTRDPNHKPQVWWIPTSQTMVYFRNQKSDENPNHKTKDLKELHLSNQNLMELNLNNPNVHLVHIRNIRCCFSNKRLTASNNIWWSEQDMNQTQVFFPGSDYTSYQE